MRFTRKAGTALVAAVVAVGASASYAVADVSTKATAGASGEQAKLQALYRQAEADGGEVTVYMGGDKPGQWDFIAKAFAAQFPGVKIHLVTDLSKIHDARIDNQIATHDQVADVAVLQTVQDFDRWESAGQLLKYRPIGSDEVFDNAKDSQGYWTGVFYGAFADMVNTKAAGSDPSAFTAADLLKPEFKKKLIFTYPNDDDAVLYDFKLTVDKYGWTWLRSLVAQNPAFVRGTPFSAGPVAAGDYLATLGTAGDPTPNATMIFPANDPFNSWVQHGAIFKNAPHKAAAKLFLSWLTSRTAQQQLIAPWTWSVRKDVAPPAGLRPLATYHQTDVAGFQAFMSDRDAVERFRSQLQLYVGQVVGPDPADPTNTLGLTPGKF